MSNLYRKCVFCQIVSGRAPAKIQATTPTSVIFEPLNPVVEGHLLAVPYVHVTDFTDEPYTTALVARDAARYAQQNMGEVNLITSRGAAATQTVFHLHFHLVPRQDEDGLKLPWTDQQAHNEMGRKGSGHGE